MALIVAGSTVSAQTYEIPWWTADAGGFTAASSPGLRQVSSTAGQPDAGGPFAGSTFVIHSGFWGLVAGGAGGAQADVSVTITNGQTTAVPGLPVTYTMTVSNAGPNAASGVWIFNIVSPISLLDVTFTCTASPGSSCPASGTNHPNHFADLAIGGLLTYSLTGTHQTALVGNFVNTITATVPSGMTDPNIANNSAADTDLMTPHADLALAMSDAPDPVGPGLQYAYTIALGNSGPSYSYGNTVTHSLPAAVTFGGWDMNVTGSCAHASGTVTCDMPPMDVGETQIIHVRATPLPTATGLLTSSATVLGDDVDPVVSNNADLETTTIGVPPRGELAHGARITADLASVGSAPVAHFYRLRQAPHSSYEVVFDGASGDIVNPGGPTLTLLAADGATELGGGISIGTGPARSMRWMNTTSSTIDGQYVRVRSAGCTIFCGPDDQYRLRMWDTTGSIPRFNNSGAQVTVVFVQNTGAMPTSGRINFWDTSGALRFELGFSIPAKGLLTTGTNFPELEGVGGSITVVSDAPYGTLVGKAVALEPSTGFSFDSPMTMRPR